MSLSFGTFHLAITYGGILENSDDNTY